MLGTKGGLVLKWLCDMCHLSMAMSAGWNTSSNKWWKGWANWPVIGQENLCIHIAPSSKNDCRQWLESTQNTTSTCEMLHSHEGESIQRNHRGYSSALSSQQCRAITSLRRESYFFYLIIADEIGLSPLLTDNRNEQCLLQTVHQFDRCQHLKNRKMKRARTMRFTGIKRHFTWLAVYCFFNIHSTSECFITVTNIQY